MNSRTKKVFFYFLLFLIPVLAIGGTELVLRLGGWFAPEPFIVKTKTGGREVYRLNLWVARRYFDPRMVTVPGVSPDVFSVHKSDRTFRIFCVGGSTTAGFPFDCQVPFPVQLRYLLSRAYPGYKFEVINAGISAVNSFTVWDLMPEILAHDPDLILIYMGHNEFYGAFGSASVVSLGANPTLVRWMLRLQHLHLTQMLKRLVSSFRRTPAKAAPQRTSLMKLLARDKEIPYGSPKYRRTLEQFRDNLSRILQMCRSKGVPVLIGDLVSNERDLRPFDEGEPQLGAGPRLQAYRNAVALGDSLARSGRPQSSLQAYLKAFSIDSTAAGLWFRIGRQYLEMGDRDRAGYYLRGARDRDPIRFRASEDFNRIIAELAPRFGARLVPIKKTFSRRSPDGLIGDSLICDHLHPNPLGYYLMARAYFEAIESSGWLRGRDPQFVAADEPYHVTPLDWEIGFLKIFKMVNSWPFSERDVTYADYRPVGDSLTYRIAYEYLFRKNVWSWAHDEMAKHHLERGDFDAAREEYLAVTVFAPEDPTPYHKIAHTYGLQKDWVNRERYLQMELPLAKNRGMIYYQIAIAQWRQGRLGDAVRSMLQAIRLPGLSPGEKLNARYYLAGFYADMKKYATAVQVLREILRDEPRFQPARMFLARLQQQLKNLLPDR